MTVDPNFKVTTFLDIEYLRNDTRYGHSYYRTSIGSRFHVHDIFDVKYRKKTARLKDKVTIAQEEIVLYLTYGMVLYLVTLTGL